MTAASPNNSGTISREDGEECGTSEEVLEWPAVIFAYLRPEQTILGLNFEDDYDDDDDAVTNMNFVFLHLYLIIGSIIGSIQ